MKIPISIIIPTFNEEKYLPNVLNSIKNQTVDPAEIIVADNNSSDKTKYIAQEFGCKLVPGGFPGRGRNIGAEAAKEEFLLFLDADVVLPADFLEKTFLEFNYKKLGIATCYIKPASQNQVDNFIYNLADFYIWLTKEFFSQANGFCIFVKREVHQEICGFDEDIILAEDFDYLKRAKEVGKFDLLESSRIWVSTRRLEEDGRLKVGLKYLALQFYLMFKGGVRRDIFKYKLGNHTSNPQ